MLFKRIAHETYSLNNNGVSNCYQKIKIYKTKPLKNVIIRTLFPKISRFPEILYIENDV